jgi:RecJ-like exonuclease
MSDNDRGPLSEYDPDYVNGRRVVAVCKRCSGEGKVWVPRADDDEEDFLWYEKDRDQRCETCRGWGYFTEDLPEDVSDWLQEECSCDCGAVFCHSSISAGPVDAWYEACPRCGGRGYILVPPPAKPPIDEDEPPF